MLEPKFGEKEMNWQNVPMQRLLEHGWDFEENETYTLRETAACQNAWAYGDIAGGGLSPYCQYNDEPAYVFLKVKSFDETIDMMTKFGWKQTNDDSDCLLMFTKGHDIVTFEGNSNQTGYLTTSVDDDYFKECENKPIEQFFDNFVWLAADEVYDETGEFEHNISTQPFQSKTSAMQYLTHLRTIAIRKFADRFAARDSVQGSKVLVDTTTRFHIVSEVGKTYYLAEIEQKYVK